MNFLELKKSCKKKVEYRTSAILMGDCATQHIATAIKGYSIEEGLPINVIDTDYNLIDAHVLDETSELYMQKPKYVIIYMCVEKLERTFVECPEKTSFAEQVYVKIENIWKTISSRINTTILQFNFIENDNCVFGNYALKTEDSFLFQVKKLNFLLSQGCVKNKNVYLLDLNGLQLEYGQKTVKDDKLYYIAKMPISIDFLPRFAKMVFDVIASIEGKFKKCIICDLDNTLWGGVIGDDGLNGIQIGELGVGHAFEDLQYWLKQLKERGIILAICSKNDEINAKEPFEKHPEMILRLDDISVFVANWEDKASNIRFIQKTLNIGMDSIVFIDDNPFERNLVKTMIPDITVPELPEDPAEYLSYLKSLNLFETASYSETDKDRTKQYQAEMQRVSLEKQFANYDEYLQSLEMLATVNPYDAFQTPRIAQLTQRSNQFNLRTQRHTESDITRFANDEKYITRYFMLQDKFGDHGLISVVLLKKTGEDLFVENWLMSCRVLKRGMEQFIADSIVKIAKDGGFKRVVGEYIPTQKNGMVKNLYSELGFEKIDENIYVAETSKYIPHKIYIKEKGDK